MFLRIFSFLCWSSHVGYKASHTRHHLYTLHPPHDLEVVLPMRLTLEGFLLSIIIDPAGFYGSVASTARLDGRLTGQWEHALFPEKPAAATAFHMGAGGPARARPDRCLLRRHGAVAGCRPDDGGHLLWPWVFFLNTYSQHTGLQDDVPDFRLCTRTIRHNPVLQFLYFHMNFHAEHHMYASVPCYNLGRLRREIEHDMPAARNMFGAWREIIGILKRQKIEPGYQYAYVLPGGRNRATPGV